MQLLSLELCQPISEWKGSGLGVQKGWGPWVKSVRTLGCPAQGHSAVLHKDKGQPAGQAGDIRPAEQHQDKGKGSSDGAAQKSTELCPAFWGETRERVQIAFPPPDKKC